MDAINAILSRRSVKNFKSNKIEKELIDKVLECGIHAPTGKNMQSPIIIAVTNKDVRDNLSRLCAKVRGLAENFDPFYNAPVVLVVLAKKYVPTYIYDGSCVLENMLLSAHDLGLGACWIHHAKAMFETQEGKNLLKSLGINADEFEGIGNCVIGYPENSPKGALPRKKDYIYYIE